MEQNKIHSSFTLHDKSFQTSDELIHYSEGLSYELHLFLIDWFNSSNFIKIKTSGSTGKPKEISLKKLHVIQSAKATGEYFKLPAETTALLCLPTSYIAGKLMVVRAIILGWKIDVIKASSNPLESLNKQYDFSAMIPMQVENSIQKLHFIKKLIVGGAPISKDLAHKLQNIKTKVYETYGMTETITHIAVKSINHNNYKPSFFEALPSVKIYKDHRNCLVIKAPRVSDTIIFTNDVVQLVSTNQFKWIGRFDNIINSGGIKLHPEEIESKLKTLLLNRFFVIGIPDDYLGQKLILIIEGSSFKIDFKDTTLHGFEKPKAIYFIDKFIETTSGKIQRRKTLEKLQTNLKD